MSKKILIVDDDRDISRMVRLSLTIEGYEVVSASTDREALEKTFFEKPDLLVLDVMLPEMDGFEVLRALRANAATANIPVIMLTGKTEEADVVKGWKSGANLYLTKPFEHEELVQVVARVLEGDTDAFPPPPGARNF